MPGRARVFSREFKEAAVRRILAGERVQILAKELELWPKLLYAWWNSYERSGPEALLPPGRPSKAVAAALAERPAPPASGGPKSRGKTKKRQTREDLAEAQRVAELERKVGQQALELDFFERALRHIKASPRPSAGRGAAASSPSSG